MTPFLDAFWPNLAATVLGVVLGVPIALFLNRHLLERQRRFEAAETNRRLMNAIDVLAGACQYNIKVLDTMRELSLSGQVMHNPDLRLTTWDAVGTILSSSCSEPDLLQMLSHHWLRLRRIQILSDEIFAREVAKSLPAITDQGVAREFWQVLHDSALSLSVHASEAEQKLGQLKTQIAVCSDYKRWEKQKDN